LASGRASTAVACGLLGGRGGVFVLSGETPHDRPKGGWVVSRHRTVVEYQSPNIKAFGYDRNAPGRGGKIFGVLTIAGGFGLITG